MNLDESKRRRRGTGRKSARLPAAEIRDHVVSVRLNAAELEQLDAQRRPVQMQRGEYLRTAALHRLPRTIPAINRQAWADLARVGANLNQLARHLNEGRDVGIGDVIDGVQALRTALLDVTFGDDAPAPTAVEVGYEGQDHAG